MAASGLLKLTRRQEDLGLFFEVAPDAIVITKRDGTIVLVNTETETLFRYRREELLGQKLEVLMPQRFRRRHVKNRAAYLRHPTVRPMGLELYGQRKDGTEFPVDISLRPVETGGDMLVSCSIRDITERKRAEEAVRQSEERFRVALQASPVVVFNQDRELRYTWINSPVLAWAKQDSLGHTDAEIVGGEEGARLTAIKQEVLRSGIGSRTETEVTFEGEKHYFDLVVEPLRDTRGTLLGLTCSASDITPTKLSLLERERLITKLQEAAEEVKQLSGLLSICASCKRICDEQGRWQPLEGYIQSHSQAKFSHGVCPDCLRKLYPQYHPESE
jgi:PAS domain S-box-containing protein